MFVCLILVTRYILVIVWFLVFKGFGVLLILLEVLLVAWVFVGKIKLGWFWDFDKFYNVM